MSKSPPDTTLDRDEIERFDALAEDFWDIDGPMRPLHKMNPARLAYIRDRLTEHHAGKTAGTGSLRPLDGLRMLDVGCGPGMVSEPLARMGADITGLDPSERNIEVARLHARTMELDIRYVAGDTAGLLRSGEPPFTAITCLEVIEHSADPEMLMADLAELLAPGGTLILSTLNRTAASFIKAIVAAEYLLGWLPRGTHSWKRFATPSETARLMRHSGLRTVDIQGFDYNPLKDSFELSHRRDTNYIMTAVKD